MSDIYLKEVEEIDFPILKHLATNCPPLDIHTSYTYWAISKLFNKHCFLAKDGEVPIGYIMCIKNNSTLLIWQIGIVKEYRKRGISKILIKAVFDSIKDENIDVYVTIAEDNKDSYYAFYSFCIKNNYSLLKTDCITITDIDNKDFIECEHMFQIKMRT